MSVKKSVCLVMIAMFVVMWGIFGCGDGDNGPTSSQVVSSRAYKGHANDQDMNHLVGLYPSISGTRLDDCQTCHTGGTVTSGGKERAKNACDFCHYIPFPDEEATGQPATYEQTLNPYGLAYKNAGRNEEGLRSIADVDSDEDDFSNKNEIAEGRYPGDAGSKPGQRIAAMRNLDMEELKALPVHSEFLLANSHRQQYDFYATYRGVKVKDLLEAVGVNLNEITGITVIAPDGFMKDFDVEAITGKSPNGLFYSGLDSETLGAECGFVDYPTTIPEGLGFGSEIRDEQWLMLAYERDGAPVETSYLDPVSGKIGGEGPLRIIVPQSTPGAPDRGSSYSPTSCEDGYDYDDSKDHNAGAMVRGGVAIQVNPMPEGTEGFDYMNGGWAYIDSGQLIVYGAGVE